MAETQKQERPRKKTSSAKPSSPRPRKRRDTEYDPAVFDEVRERIAATREQRVALDAQRAADLELNRTVREIYKILDELGRGTATMKVQHNGDLIVDTSWYARRLRRLATLWNKCDWLAGRPALLIHDRTKAEPRGFRAGRIALDLALKGDTVKNLERCIRDARDVLRELSSEGLISATNDMPHAIPGYFEQLAHWYQMRNAEVYEYGEGPVTPTVYVEPYVPSLNLYEPAAVRRADDDGEKDRPSPLELAMSERALDESQRARVRRAASALDSDAREFIPSRDLVTTFGVPPQTVAKDCRKHTGNASRRGRQGHGPVAFERNYLREFVTQRWYPMIK